MYPLSDYDYDLPQELIAQKPVAQRDGSRLLHLNRASNEVAHYHFADLYHFLSPDDVLVLNNTEVIPGRLYGHKTTGGKIEVLLLDYAGGRTDHGPRGGRQLHGKRNDGTGGAGPVGHADPPHSPPVADRGGRVCFLRLRGERLRARCTTAIRRRRLGGGPG